MRLPISGPYGRGQPMDKEQMIIVLVVYAVLAVLIGGGWLLYDHAYQKGFEAGKVKVTKTVMAQARTIAKEDMEQVMREHCVFWFDAGRRPKGESDIVACRKLPFMVREVKQ